MREPRPDWSPLGVNFKILDEHPYLFYISSPPPPPGPEYGWLSMLRSTYRARDMIVSLHAQRPSKNQASHFVNDGFSRLMQPGF